jgi:hypothetical protein
MIKSICQKRLMCFQNTKLKIHPSMKQQSINSIKNLPKKNRMRLSFNSKKIKRNYKKNNKIKLTMREERKLLMIFMLKRKLKKKLKSSNNNCKISILLKKKLKVLLHSQLNKPKKLNKK